VGRGGGGEDSERLEKAVVSAPGSLLGPGKAREGGPGMTISVGVCYTAVKKWSDTKRESAFQERYQRRLMGL